MRSSLAHPADLALADYQAFAAQVAEHVRRFGPDPRVERRLEAELALCGTDVRELARIDVRGVRAPSHMKGQRHGR